MRIHSIECRQEGIYSKLSAHIGKLHLWFRFPARFELDAHDATSFVTAALLPSMLLGEDLLVDNEYFVSERFLSSLDDIQEIYHCWNPVFRPIKVIATARPVDRSGSGCASFFSGGVDGTYTLCKHKDEIEHLILINGFDFNMGNITWRRMVDRNREFAAQFGKELVAVETNYKAFTLSTNIMRFANYGTCLAAISQALCFDKVFISGADTYEHLPPSGSHPLLDPLWSTERTRLVHTGLSADRSGKLALIKQYPEAIASLWVCWQDPRRNCGACSKCIRTYVALRLNNVTGLTFERPVTIRDVKRLSIRNEDDCRFFSHFLDQAMEQGDRELAKILGRMIGRYKRKRFLLEIDKYFFLGSMKRLQLHLRPEKHLSFLSVNRKLSDHDSARRAILKLKDEAFVQRTASIGSVYFNDAAYDEDVDP